MSWLQRISQMDKRVFIGQCVSGLDDPGFCDIVGYDATEMAQLVENGQEISFQDFLSKCILESTVLSSIESEPNRYIFFINIDRNILWIYDKGSDIHYFYA
jgi:hypothetical protein